MAMRCLRGDARYCVDMAPFIAVVADYFEARAREGLSRQDREDLRLAAYRVALPELKASFEAMITDWEARLAGESWQWDLGGRSLPASDTVALIHFLRSI
jgi:hypothetical protein